MSDAPTDRDRVPRGARAAEPIPTDELAAYEGLFLLVSRLRAVSADALWRLFFLPALGVTSRSAALRRVERLVRGDYLRHMRLSAWRSVYHLSWRGLVAFPSVRARGSDNTRKPPSLETAHYAWLRSGFHAQLSSDGFTVGRGPRELAALRRFYVDRQIAAVSKLAEGAGRADAQLVLDQLRAEASLKPPFRTRCAPCGASSPLNALQPGVERCAGCGARTKNDVPARVYRCRTCGGLTDGLGPHVASETPSRHCPGTLREIDVVNVDVAWRRIGAAYEVIGLLVDDPHRSVERQLEDIPAQIVGQPRLPLILRTTDPRSRYEPRTRTWRVKGPRHQALLRAFEDDVHEALFPFSLTTTVIDYRPELELWTVYQGAKR